MQEKNPKFNETLAPLWATKNGDFMSIEIGQEQFDALQAVQVGGKLIVKVLPAERRKTENSPHAYLEYKSVAKITQEKADREARTGEAKLQARKATTGI